MPFKPDSQTGQYDFESYGDSGQQQPEVLIAAAPPKKKEDKPWWEQVGDSIMKGPGIGRYVQLDERGLVINTDNISNDLQYEAKRLTKSPQSAGQRLLDYATTSPHLNLLVPGGTDLNTEARAASAQALGNAGKALYPAFADRNNGLLTPLTGDLSIEEPEPLPENPTEEQTAKYNKARDRYDKYERDLELGTLDFEARVDEAVESVYVSSEKKPRSEMTDSELAGDDFKASIALNSALVAGSVFLPGSGLISRASAAWPRLAPLFNATNFTAATTKRGFITKLFAANALDEVPSTYLDDNTGGSAVQLPAFVFNYFGATELAEAFAAMEPVKPGMSRTEASNAAFGPNLTASTTFAGIIGSGTAALSRVLNLGLPNTRRARQAKSQRNTRQAAREQLEADGITQSDETGKTAFTEEAVKPKDASWAEAERELVEEVGLREPEAPREIPTDEMAPGGAVDARGQMPEPVDADIDPWTAEYDPSSTVEADALLETVQGQLDADDLAEVIARGETENIPAVVDELAQRAQPEQIDAEMATDNVVAPTENLSGTGTTADRFASVSVARLWSLAMNTPELAQEIVLRTGKDQNQWTRMDIIDGISALEGRGLSVMPNRMMGFPMMRTADINLDVERFQYKQGVNKSGVQKGNSLDGVELWSQDSEGLIQVWEDPADGLTYVVNGHNRLAKAKELGVPTLRVEQINAPDWKSARMKGAITNIADGRGTAFDAGKYFRDAGITDLSELGKEVPMKSGLANDGLALSRLPDNIFRAAQDGVITLKKAVALGNSGLDETAMQEVYKILSKRNMSDDVFREVLEQGRSSTTVEGSQVDIFGNTEMLNTMETKAELVADIRRQLGTTKKAARSAAKNASTLETAGNSIDRAGSQTLAEDTDALIRQFDADKYMDTPLSQKLNEGAEQILQGAKRNVVVNRIKREIVEVAETTPLTDATPTPEPVPATPTRRDQERTLLTMAARKGEARPPESPLLETPDPGDVQLDGKPEPIAALDVMDNEARVKDEYKVIDDAIKGDELEAKRAEIGYDEMTFEQKKANGMLDGFENAVTKQGFDPLEEIISNPNERFTLDKKVLGSPKPRYSDYKLEFQDNLDLVAYMIRNNKKASKAEAKYIAALTEQGFDIGKVRTLGDEVLQSIKEQVKLADGRKGVDAIDTIEIPRSEIDLETVKPTAEGNARADYLDAVDRAMRPISAKTSPNLIESTIEAYAKYTRTDLDRARTVVKGVNKIFDPDKVKFLDMDKARADFNMGRRSPEVEAVGDAYRAAYRTDGGGGGLRASSGPGGGDGPRAKYKEEKTRKMLQRAADMKAEKELDALMDFGVKLPGSVARMVQMSEALGKEMVEGLKDAARISGLDPMRIQYLDRIETRKMFGDEDAFAAIEQWNPDAARFARENPQDPLTDIAAGVLGGVYVPRNYPSIHRGMIYLALGPNLDTRFASKFIEARGGELMGKTAYHEAFHAVQDWMRQLDTDMKFTKALTNPAAVEEMTELIKKDPFGNYQKGMAQDEIEAEAFAVWYNNRKVRLKSGGLQAAFERMKKFINTVRRKWKVALDKDPSYVDIFEMAASGKIAEKGNLKVNKLTDQQLEALSRRMDRNMDQMLPSLTERVEEYLVRKQVEFDSINEELAVDLTKGDC